MKSRTIGLQVAVSVRWKGPLPHDAASNLRHICAWAADGRGRRGNGVGVMQYT